MRENPIENEAIQKLDYVARLKETEGLSKPTEQVVVSFFDSEIPGLSSRFSTEHEDDGIEKGGKAIDTVSYVKDKPVFASQVTVDNTKHGREKKMKEMMSHPFLRLAEMKREDKAIPRILIFVDAKQIKEFAADQNFSKHPDVAIQICDSALHSLTFVKTQTKNPHEIDAIGRLITMFETARKKFVQ